MKIYEIFDEENGLTIGVLLYYEKANECIIELQDYLDEWTAPFMFMNHVKNKTYTIPRDSSFAWVKSRVIPSGRQNISSILAHHKLKTYEEMRFLEISKGRCCQDSMYIKKIDSLPDYVINRQKRNVVDCLVCDNHKLICFFADEKTKMIELKKLSHIDDVDKILSFDALYRSGKVGLGGYSVTFNDSIDIPAKVLYEAGTDIPVTLKDFISFVRNNVYDTTESCSELECSRQNIAYMVKQNQLEPIKEEAKGNLYIKGDVLKNKWG